MEKMKEKSAMEMAAGQEEAERIRLQYLRSRRKVFGLLVLGSVLGYGIFLALLPFGLIPAKFVMPLLALFTAELVILWTVMKILDRRDSASGWPPPSR
ncbi:MAG: hypothetical protein PHW69_00910 [Elusimicrobiaceae bacterium]|nr:hypothetical protein [Elusimicrobiaceae bacterium]